MKNNLEQGIFIAVKWAILKQTFKWFKKKKYYFSWYISVWFAALCVKLLIHYELLIKLSLLLCYLKLKGNSEPYEHPGKMWYHASSILLRSQTKDSKESKHPHNSTS